MVSRDTRVNLLISTGHFLSHFYALCLPPLFVVWQREFNISFGELGVAAVLMSIMAAIMQTPYGFLVDRFGARRFLIGGTLIMSVAISSMAFATAYWQILALAVVSGLGNGIFHPADYAILAGSISKEKMGRSFALHSLSGNVGFAVAPPVVAVLLAFIGWRDTLMLLGLLGIPVAGAIAWQSSILKDQVRKKKSEGSLTIATLVMQRSLMMFFVFYVLGSMASSGVQAWLITVLHEVKGLELGVASWALTAFLVGSGAGVILGGWASDRSSRYLAVFVVGLTVVSSALMLFVGALPLGGSVITVLLFVSGVALGASRTPRDVMLKDAAPPGEIGKVFGFVSAGMPLGAALTPIPFGMLIDRGHAEYVLILAAGLLLASLFFMGGARASAAKEEAALPAAAE